MKISKIKQLIELINKTGIAEIELREGEESVRLSRFSSVSTPVTTQMTSPTTTLEISPETELVEPTATTPPPASSVKGHTVKSPMVGTLYLAPSPEAKPFIEVGQMVKIGDPLCIIEAMKMFNEIEADKAGEISAILVENAQAVEYEQPLFIIEPKKTEDD